MLLNVDLKIIGFLLMVLAAAALNAILGVVAFGAFLVYISGRIMTFEYVEAEDEISEEDWP